MQIRVADTGNHPPPDGVGNAMGLCGGTSRATLGSINYLNPRSVAVWSGSPYASPWLPPLRPSPHRPSAGHVPHFRTQGPALLSAPLSAQAKRWSRTSPLH